MLLGLWPLPAVARTIPRRFFSAAVDAVAPDAREKIAVHILRQRQKGVSVRWNYLKKRFDVSKEVAKQIEVQAAAAAKRSSPVSARMTRLADDAYDTESGQRDWSAVARKAGLPLVECLGHFSPELSKHPARPRPTLDDWSTKDILAVRELLHELPKALHYDAWNLAGAYINADPSDCRDVFGMVDRRMVAPKIVAALRRHHDNGMRYEQLHQRFPIYGSHTPLAGLFRRRSKEAARGERAQGIDTVALEDRKHIRRAVQELYRPGNLKAIVQRLVRELPHIDPHIVGAATANVVVAKRCAVKSKIGRLAKLVGAFGDDWERIGQELDTTPSFAKSAWIRHTAKKAASAKDAAAVGIAGNDSGVSPGSSPDPPRKWTPKDYSKLTQLVADYGDEPVDWAAVGEVLGRSMDSCRIKYGLCQRSLPADPKQALADAVDAEVQKQLASGSGVDWEQVGQTAGLDVRKCLELCRVDEGKGRWDYDPDTFSWATAKRMEAFIANSYPLPAVPNFRAVSNYLWIDIDDCIRMADVLKGKIKMTDELRARVAEMRQLGMTYTGIARELTPYPLLPQVLRPIFIGARTPYAPAPPELRERVDDFLDNNAEGCTFHELIGLAKVHFEGPEKRSAVVCVRTRAACHKAYAARLEKVDVAAAYEQVASRKVACRDMAAQLGVPPMSLKNLFASHESKVHSSTWTDVEVAQLKKFVDKSSPPYSWVGFAKMIGTKSVQQCRIKYCGLQKARRVT